MYDLLLHWRTAGLLPPTTVFLSRRRAPTSPPSQGVWWWLAWQRPGLATAVATYSGEGSIRLGWGQRWGRG
jgi:hypothetical protein